MDLINLLIQNYCKNFYIEDFYRLPHPIQQLFFKYSTEILMNPSKGFLGLAYIINNAITPPINYIKTNYVYGIQYINVYYSKKYNMEIYMLSDTHTYDYRCPNNSSVTQNAAKFIENQIKTSSSFVDLFLEIPYITKEKKIQSSDINNTYMRTLQDNLQPCFDWLKTDCKYPHLRAHYIDFRKTIELDYLYLQFEQLISNIFFKKINKKKIKYTILNTKLINIFETKNSLIKYIKQIIKKTKYNIQLKNINDTHIQNIIKKYEKIWFENVNYNTLKWSYITKVLTNIMEKDDERGIYCIYFNLSILNGILMDLYTISRMFRSYRSHTPTINKFSGRAQKIIVYIGGYHIDQYEKILEDLYFTKKVYMGESRENGVRYKKRKDEFTCVDVSNLPQPIFNSKFNQKV